MAIFEDNTILAPVFVNIHIACEASRLTVILWLLYDIRHVIMPFRMLYQGK